MKRNWKIGFCAMVAALCLGVALSNSASVLGILAQPFSAIGAGLRTMSLSGTGGNLGAIVLYALVCLSPLLLLWKRKPQREDLLLLCCSAMLFYVMYQMVNPHRIGIPANPELGKMILGGSVYSVLITWGVLKLLKRSTGEFPIYRTLRVFLTVCAAACFVAAFGVGTVELRGDLLRIRQANTMPGLNLMPTYLVCAGLFCVTALEYTLDGLVLLRGIRLLEALEADPYSEDCVTAANAISKLCAAALRWITLSNMAMNVVQAVMINSLHNVDVSIRIPIGSMAIVFAAMGLTKLLVRGKEIKDDNDLFV